MYLCQRLSLALAIVFSFACSSDTETPPNDVVWIDVRSSEEYVEEHLENATLIPHNAIVEGVTALGLSKDTPIYLYCHSGGRAEQAKRALENQNYTHVNNVGSLANARSLAKVDNSGS